MTFCEQNSGPKMYLKSATVVKQPADNSCLYHSLNYNLNHEDLYNDVYNFERIIICNLSWTVWNADMILLMYEKYHNTGILYPTGSRADPPPMGIRIRIRARQLFTRKLGENSEDTLERMPDQSNERIDPTQP
jgi:hypothetical protein